MNRRESTTWTLQDLQSLIKNQIQEDSDLEYKGSGSLQKTERKRTDLAKDVSSFANSAGGIIIYGICEDDHNHLPQNLDGELDPQEITKEWVEDVIQGNIHPRIQGVDINQVDLGAVFPGKIAYVITIPQSDTAHQASDKRNYKRFNFQAVAMGDHEIRDVMNRNKYPKVTPIFQISKGYPQDTNLRELHVILENQGPMSAKTIKLTIWWPDIFTINNPTSFTPKAWRNKLNIAPGILEFSVYLESKVLFPFEICPLEEFVPPTAAMFRFSSISQSHPTYKSYRTQFLMGNLVLSWQIFADDMPPGKEEIPLEKIFQVDDFFSLRN